MLTARGRADRAFATLVRSRGRCERCGERRLHLLQCAHIVSRRYQTVRVDPDNAVCLCVDCHRFMTERPRLWRQWVEGRWPGRLEVLWGRVQGGGRGDWPSMADRLERLVRSGGSL
jgi:5-methylcytosine-specific restriction endonuclease McrA